MMILTEEIDMVLNNILIEQENLNLLKLLYVVQIHLSKKYNLKDLILLSGGNFLLDRLRLKKYIDYEYYVHNMK